MPNSKGLIVSVYAMSFDEGTYYLTANAGCITANGSFHPIVIEVTAQSFNPVAGGTWRDRLRAELIAKAADWHEVTVDEVIFQDLGIL